ncbi:MAG: response regulator transcription factor [Gemmatimonadaceae bacterium]|nr:response regulator transcription factor [Gemmatimonadaceae bacterium]
MPDAKADWHVMIADDEPAARRGVRQLLARYPAFQVVAECRNGTEVLTRLDETSADVIFLDVQMPGLDGFEVIRQRTPERMPIIVFLTAYEDFALKAFEAQALDYLVKPVTEARFDATIKRLLRALGAPTATTREPSLSVPTARGTLVLKLAEIEWIEAADNYSRIWSGGRSHLLRESLTAMDERVSAHGFIRAHRQAIVRIGAIRKTVRTSDDDLVLVLLSGTRVPVSRRRRLAVVSAVRRISGP